jgi:thiol-disulfide isomerase/thioredoxin
MWIPILIAIVFVGVFIGWYRYMRGFYPGSTIIEVEATQDPNSPTLKFFYTTWCPHSRKALPEWKSLKSMGRVYGGKTLQFETLDGDSSKTETARYGIEAYPCLVLVTPTTVVHYDGHLKAAHVHSWLVRTLGPQS